jgi:molybdopterin converting factor small subunit
MEQVVIEVRAFAAARAALGWAWRQVAVVPGSTVADVIALLADQSPAAVAVLGRCAAFLDGRRVTDVGAAVIPPGARLDLLPPFAGG